MWVGSPLPSLAILRYVPNERRSFRKLFAVSKEAKNLESYPTRPVRFTCIAFIKYRPHIF